MFLAILFGMGLLSVNTVGWMGGYGGMWVPILLIIVVVAVVAWMLGRKSK